MEGIIESTDNPANTEKPGERRFEQKDLPRITAFVRDIFTKEFVERGFIEPQDTLPEIRERHWNTGGQALLDAGALGTANIRFGHVQIKEGIPLSEAIMVAVHEAAHMYSDRDYLERSERGITQFHTSFHEVSREPLSLERDNFRGFNEAIVHAFTMHMLEKYRHDIQRSFPDIPIHKVLQAAHPPYERDRLTLKTIARKVTAKRKGTDNTPEMDTRAFMNELFHAQFRDRETRNDLLEEVKSVLPLGGLLVLSALGKKSDKEVHDRWYIEKYDLFEQFLDPSLESLYDQDTLAEKIIGDSQVFHLYLQEKYADALPKTVDDVITQCHQLTDNPPADIKNQTSEYKNLRKTINTLFTTLDKLSRSTKEFSRYEIATKAMVIFDRLKSLKKEGNEEQREIIIDELFKRGEWTTHQYDHVLPNKRDFDNDVGNMFASTSQVIVLAASERRQLAFIYNALERQLPALQELLSLRTQLRDAEVRLIEKFR